MLQPCELCTISAYFTVEDVSRTRPQPVPLSSFIPPSRPRALDVQKESKHIEGSHFKLNSIIFLLLDIKDPFLLFTGFCLVQLHTTYSRYSQQWRRDHPQFPVWMEPEMPAGRANVLPFLEKSSFQTT